MQEVLEIGDTAEDGYIYAGTSMDTDSPGCDRSLWVAPENAGVMTHYKAERTAACLKASLPTGRELSQIFNGLAKEGLGGFDKNNGKYWAAECDSFFLNKAVYKDFSSNGKHGIRNRDRSASARFVRYDTNVKESNVSKDKDTSEPKKLSLCDKFFSIGST